MFNDRIKLATAKDLIKGDIFVVQETWTIHRLLDFFAEKKITAAPVIDSNKELTGVVSASDILAFDGMASTDKNLALQKYYAENFTAGYFNESLLRDWTANTDNCVVHQIMTKNVIAVDVCEPLESLSGTILDNNIHRIFVTENKAIVGVISLSDILRFIFK